MKKLLNRKFILVLLVIFFASAAAALAVPDKLKPGTKAPGFSLKDVKTGENVNLSDFKDKKIVIVHFWKSK